MSRSKPKLSYEGRDYTPPIKEMGNNATAIVLPFNFSEDYRIFSSLTQAVKSLGTDKTSQGYLFLKKMEFFADMLGLSLEDIVLININKHVTAEGTGVFTEGENAGNGTFVLTLDTDTINGTYSGNATSGTLESTDNSIKGTWHVDTGLRATYTDGRKITGAWNDGSTTNLTITYETIEFNSEFNDAKFENVLSISDNFGYHNLVLPYELSKAQLEAFELFGLEQEKKMLFPRLVTFQETSINKIGYWEETTSNYQAQPLWTTPIEVAHESNTLFESLAYYALILANTDPNVSLTNKVLSNITAGITSEYYNPELADLISAKGGIGLDYIRSRILKIIGVVNATTNKENPQILDKNGDPDTEDMKIMNVKDAVLLDLRKKLIDLNGNDKLQSSGANLEAAAIYIRKKYIDTLKWLTLFDITVEPVSNSPSVEMIVVGEQGDIIKETKVFGEWRVI